MTISIFDTTAEAAAQSDCLLAQVEENVVAWFIRCCGLLGILELLAAIGVFVGACLVVALARHPEQ
jgi:hypothetical protein